MHVQDAKGPLRDELGREDAHETREADEIGTSLFERLGELALPLEYESACRAPVPITFEEIPRARAFTRPAAEGTSEATRTIRAGISPRSQASARASKFEPRPESRTARRAGSGTSGFGCVRRSPQHPCSDEADLPLALLNAPDLLPVLAARVQPRLDLEASGRRDDQDHADAAVEDPQHLGGRDASLVLQEPEERRPAPGVWDGRRRRGPAGRTRGMLSGNPPPVMWAMAERRRSSTSGRTGLR